MPLKSGKAGLRQNIKRQRKGMAGRNQRPGRGGRGELHCCRKRAELLMVRIILGRLFFDRLTIGIQRNPHQSVHGANHNGGAPAATPGIKPAGSNARSSIAVSASMTAARRRLRTMGDNSAAMGETVKR